MELLTFAIPIVMLALLIRILVAKKALAGSFLLYSCMRPRHYLVAVPLVLAIIPLAVKLAQVPGLGFGWWSLIGGTGSAVSGTTESTGTSLLSLLVPALLLVVLFLLLPLLAASEERSPSIGRIGSESRSWPQRVRVAALFGLVHMIMGIPLGAALAIGVAGLVFTLVYLRAYKKACRRAITDPELLAEHDLVQVDGPTPGELSISASARGVDLSGLHFAPTPHRSGVTLYERADAGAVIVRAGGGFEQALTEARERATKVAVVEVTMVHTAYNSLIFGFAALTLLVSALSL